MDVIRVPYLVGDVWERMAEMDDGSVDLVLTSPPFLALRSYLPPEHPDKAKEIGSEPTPAEFLDTLLALTAEWGRLVGDGSIAVELGDTYAGSGGAGGDYNPGGWREGQGKAAGSAKWDRSAGRRAPGGQPYADTFKGGGPGGTGWPLPKSLCFIPQLYGASLAYGRNLLTGEESPAGQWRVRNVVRWVRPNPPVGALGDKFRPATSEMIVATKAKDRWFDLDAVRTGYSENSHARTAKGAGRQQRTAKTSPDGNRDSLDDLNNDGAGAPPLDWWEIPTAPYKGAHYATWPPALCERPIKSMCPERVCRTCGEPSTRVMGAYTLDSYRSSRRPQTIRAVELADEAGLTDDHIAAVRAFGTSDAGKAQAINNGAGKNTAEVKRLAAEAKAVLGGYFREFVMTTNVRRSSSWSDCGHDDWRPGVVLDPFAGSGTTLAVATGLGRAAIGIDLDDRNVDLARERCRMTRWVDDAGAVFWTTRRGKNHLLWSSDQAVGGKVADAVWKHPDVTRIAERYGLVRDGVVKLDVS